MPLITRLAVEQAAFWHESVCLSCGSTQPQGEVDATCEECGEQDLITAEQALRVLNAVGDSDEGDDE